MLKNLTICTNCDNLLKDEGNDIWYNFYCTAKPKEPEIDFLTGRVKQGFCNQFEYCRDINKDGQCPHYVKKNEFSSIRSLLRALQWG